MICIRSEVWLAEDHQIIEILSLQKWTLIPRTPYLDLKTFQAWQGVLIRFEASIHRAWSSQADKKNKVFEDKNRLQIRAGSHPMYAVTDAHRLLVL